MKGREVGLQILFIWLRNFKFRRAGLHPVTKKYVAVDDAELSCTQVSSAMLFTDLSMPVNIKLPVKLPSAAAEGMSILCVVGIAFYAGKELMKGECGMGVVKIFI